jgi:signal transduction histidine kinase
VLEMNHLVDLLRRGDEQAGLHPQPGLADLAELLRSRVQGDLTVSMQVEGEPRPLSASVELSAYRVIQEALTNARKHSGATTATVRLGYEPATLVVDVVDDGLGARAASVGRSQGHGLIGMRERASLHGGQVRAGPRPEGGFAVHATFPLDRPS